MGSGIAEVAAKNGFEVILRSRQQATADAMVAGLEKSLGKQVETTATYANRAVTLSGLDLKEGAQYRLVVLTTVRDVLGHNVAAEYDLDVVGPSLKKHGNHKDAGSSSPSSSSPSPSATSAP